MARVVLIETSGNQDFVFSTNKLRQNIGASELIHRIGTTFVISAVATKVEQYAALAADLDKAAADPEKAKVEDGKPIATADYVRRLRQAIEKAGKVSDRTAVEVLIATSGKAVLLVDSEQTGKDIVRAVTLRALIEAPGAVVRGVVDDADIDLDGQTKRDAHARMKAVHRALDALRFELPAPEARFQVLPVTALCTTSGLPAEHSDGDEMVSEPALRKRKAAEAGWRRIRASLGTTGNRLAFDVGRLDDMELSWFGVVHADGNGFGKVFLDLASHIPPARGDSARSYFDFYRDLSFSLDLAGVVALDSALESVRSRSVHVGRHRLDLLPVVPLVFGGDDVTVICEGRQAVSFTVAYLRAFETATSADSLSGMPSVIPQLVDPVTRKPKAGFGGGGGIAIVKPHHPFHRAYELAAALTVSAKTTKSILKANSGSAQANADAVSAFDFQIVYDDAAADLDKLRSAWSVGSSILHNRPYVVSTGDRIEVGSDDARGWIKSHHVDGLRDAVNTLRARASDDDDRPRLPRSQQHTLRSALFAGKDVADARLALIRDRYADPSDSRSTQWEVFGESDKSLFYATGETFRTRFLDALELIDLDDALNSPANPASEQEAANG